MKKNNLSKVVILICFIGIWTLIIYGLAIIIHNKLAINVQDGLTFLGLIFSAAGMLAFFGTRNGGAVFESLYVPDFKTIIIDNEFARSGHKNMDFLRGFNRKSIFSFKLIMIGMIIGGVIDFLVSILMTYYV